MKKNEISKYYLLGLIFLIIFLAFLIIRPFITDILASIVISYIFYPLYSKLSTKINKTIAAFLVCGLIILTVTLPIIFLVNSIYGESFKIYREFKESLPVHEAINGCKENNGIVCNAVTYISVISSNPVIKGSIEKFPALVLKPITSALSSIPKIILHAFIILFITYYLLKDGHKLYDEIMKVLPIKKEHQDILVKSFKDVTYAVIYGHVIVALIQGALGTLGFIILGVPSPILLGAIMTITALIPILGTGIVWLPTAIILISSGIIQQSNSLQIKGVILLLYGALIISTIDNFLRPKIIGSKADVHPLLVLLGVLGGLAMFGFIGIIIGPVILAACIVMIKLYLTRKADTTFEEDDDEDKPDLLAEVKNEAQS